MKLGHLFDSKQYKQSSNNTETSGRQHYHENQAAKVWFGLREDDKNSNLLRFKKLSHKEQLNMDDNNNSLQQIVSIQPESVGYSLETLTTNRNHHVESSSESADINLVRQFKSEQSNTIVTSNATLTNPDQSKQERCDTNNNHNQLISATDDNELYGKTLIGHQLDGSESEQNTATKPTNKLLHQQSPKGKTISESTPTCNRTQSGGNNNGANAKKTTLLHDTGNQQHHQQALNQNKRFVCHGCNKSIRDRYIMKVYSMRNKASNVDSNTRVFRSNNDEDLNTADENCLLFHENCLKCSICNCSLEKTCFARENKLFCPNDYFR